MASWGRVLAAGRRVLTVASLILAVIATFIFVLLAQDLYWFLPPAMRRHRLGLVLGGLAAAYAVGRLLTGRQPAGRPATSPLRWMLDRLDGLAGSALAGGLPAVIAAICLAFLATWVPHYLLWPWYRDTDTFATLAQSWDAGILPYRDIRAYNFPGAIYLSWVLGKVVGWGQTWAFNAVDAAALILLGVALTAWSRRCLGGVLPGVAAYLVFLTFYLNRDYETVAQRDWHASLCVVLGLLILQAWPGRTSRVVSALLTAAALAIRPHVVVFLPALGAAVAEGAKRPGTEPAPGRPGLIQFQSLAEWSLALVSFTVLAFAPLLIAGVADDLVRGLKVVAFGGPYNHADFMTMALVFADELREPVNLIAIGLVGLTLVSSRGESRRRAATWALALSAALLYRLFHPVQHYYLIYPVALVSSVAMALPIAWLVDRTKLAPFLRVTALLLLIYEMSPGLPLYCDWSATLEALDSLARGQTLPASSPPGSLAWFDLARGRWHTWDDYRRVLIYIRETTGPATLVANVLKEPPFPAINGPTARLSPFRAESGICWMWLIDLDLDAEFAASLEQATDSVVVWAPAEHEVPSQLRLEHLAAAIRKHYRFEARFGRIEVWRRASGPPHEFDPP